jgi:hypothetical protein
MEKNMSREFRKPMDEFRLDRIRRRKFGPWYRYHQIVDDYNRTPGSYICREDSWHKYFRLIEDVNFNMRAKK